MSIQTVPEYEPPTINTHRGGSVVLPDLSVGEGPEGPPGPGVEDGGTTGQVLRKASNADQDTEWATLDADDIADGVTNRVYTNTEKTKLAGVATGATANQTDAYLLDRANHTGTQSADTVVDGSTNHVFTAADDTKLAGIATGATANDTDANLKNRANHTGTQLASTISDFAEVVRDTMGTALVAGTNISITVDDGADTITIASTGASGGGVLASHKYGAADKTVTSTTLADFDSTNLAITFTAPDSGSVIVRLTGYLSPAATNTWWGLREGTTTIDEGEVNRHTTIIQRMCTMEFKVTGLTPSNSYTYKWAGRSNSGSVSVWCSTGADAVLTVLSA